MAVYIMFYIIPFMKLHMNKTSLYSVLWYSFYKSCLDSLLRPWLEASRFSFLDQSIKFNTSLTVFSHYSHSDCPSARYQLRTVLCYKACWNYSNQLIWSLFTLTNPIPFRRNQNKGTCLLFLCLSLPFGQPWCLTWVGLRSMLFLSRELWV